MMCLSYAGSTASSVVMLFPPTSSRKVVRLQNAATITKLSKLYAFLVATWISTGNIHVDDDSDSDDEDLTYEPIGVLFEALSLSDLKSPALRDMLSLTPLTAHTSKPQKAMPQVPKASSSAKLTDSDWKM